MGRMNSITNTPKGEPGEFGYSPTVDESLDHGGAESELNTSFLVHMPGTYTPSSNYSTNRRNCRMHTRDGGGWNDICIGSSGGAAEVAWLTSTTGHGHSNTLPGVNAIGLSV